MTKNERKRLMKKAIEKYGEKAQLEMLMEESLELSLAVRKFLRDPSTSRHLDVISEIADVENMIEQFHLIMKGRKTAHSVENQKVFKMRRLATRMGEKIKVLPDNGIVE